jgi:hypothetical protein
METGDGRSNLRGSASGCSRSRVRLARVGAVGSVRGVGGRSSARRRRRRQLAADRARRGSRRERRIDRDWSTATRGDAPAFVAGGLAAWAALFAWRAGVSETSGANMFVVPLVMIFIPVVVITPLVLGAVASRLNRR